MESGKGYDVESVLDSIYESYGVDILSGKRDRFTSDFRKMFCSHMYRTTRMTLSDIACVIDKSVGNVFYYITTHDKQMEESQAYADRFADFQDRMKASAN